MKKEELRFTPYNLSHNYLLCLISIIEDIFCNFATILECYRLITNGEEKKSKS